MICQPLEIAESRFRKLVAARLAADVHRRAKQSSPAPRAATVAIALCVYWSLAPPAATLVVAGDGRNDALDDQAQPMGGGLEGARAGRDLKGTVVDQGERAIASARVLAYTATPKRGVSTVCAHCYPDCGKQAITLRDGRFCLSRLDTTLLFRLLVLPPGRLPQFVDKVEPSDAALVVRIKDRPRLDKRLLIRGRVIDPAGNPIVGASVEPIGRMWPGRRSFGHLPVLDPVAISDQYGNFEISTKDTSGGYFLRVTARGFASRMVQNVRVGMGRQRIKLEEGAWVAGRVLRDNEPLTGAVVGICQLDRDAGSFVGGQRLSTDSTGRFNLFNVVPDDEHVVYVETRSVTPYWIPAETLRVMGSGSRMDAGVLRAQTGVALAGHVTLIDGQRLPADARVVLQRFPARDYVVEMIDSSGSFAFRGAPRETCDVSFGVAGYRLVADQRDLDIVPPGVVRLFPDGRSLEVRLEPSRQ